MQRRRFITLGTPLAVHDRVPGGVWRVRRLEFHGTDGCRDEESRPGCSRRHEGIHARENQAESQVEMIGMFARMTSVTRKGTAIASGFYR